MVTISRVLTEIHVRDISLVILLLTILTLYVIKLFNLPLITVTLCLWKIQIFLYTGRLAFFEHNPHATELTSLSRHKKWNQIEKDIILISCWQNTLTLQTIDILKCVIIYYICIWEGARLVAVVYIRIYSWFKPRKLVTFSFHIIIIWNNLSNREYLHKEAMYLIVIFAKCKSLTKGIALEI